MKNAFLIIFLFYSINSFTQTSLSGKVIYGDGVGAVLANVALYKGFDLVTGVQTDFDGFYNFANLDAGTYEVEVSYVGFGTVRYIKVIVYGARANSLDIELSNEQGVQIFEYKPPVIDNRNNYHYSMNEHIKKLPTADLKKYLELKEKRRLKTILKNNPKYYPASLAQKLPARSIHSTVQNMLDLGIKTISFERVEVGY